MLGYQPQMTLAAEIDMIGSEVLLDDVMDVIREICYDAPKLAPEWSGMKSSDEIEAYGHDTAMHQIAERLRPYLMRYDVGRCSKKF